MFSGILKNTSISKEIYSYFIKKNERTANLKRNQFPLYLFVTKKDIHGLDISTVDILELFRSSLMNLCMDLFKSICGYGFFKEWINERFTMLLSN